MLENCRKANTQRVIWRKTNEREVDTVRKEQLDFVRAAKYIKDFCYSTPCTDCPMWQSVDEYNGTCKLHCYPGDWPVKSPKTYAEDFLEKFPNADIANKDICRCAVYGGNPQCAGKTCAECWGEVYKWMDDDEE